jgi:hypothetical protein
MTPMTLDELVAELTKGGLAPHAAKALAQYLQQLQAQIAQGGAK